MRGRVTCRNATTTFRVSSVPSIKLTTSACPDHRFRMDINRIHHQPRDISSSPSSELSSSDSESCNTSTSRVHFGPLRSPEKRFMALGHRRQHSVSPNPRQQPRDLTQEAVFDPLPHPYNTRPPQDINHDSSDENQDDDDPANSRSRTPENIQLSTDGEH